MQLSKPATMQDIAKRTGVSKQAVSAVLSGSQSGTRVSAALRDQILATAAEMRYHPNTLARSLRGRSTNTIGFYSSRGLVTSRDPFFGELIDGLSIGCADTGKNLTIFHCRPERPRDEIYGELAGGQIDGLIVLLSSKDPLASRLAASSLPVVAIADTVSGLPSVVVDDRGGSRMAAQYLARRGHKTVHYWRNAPGETDDSLSTVRRYNGFLEAATELDMVVFKSSNDTALYARELGLERRAAPDSLRPTAAVGYPDATIYQLLTECRERGIRVPEDLAIMGGFDGCHPHQDHLPNLTTIRADWTDVARTAVSLVNALLEGKEAPPETVMPVELIIGDTA